MNNDISKLNNAIKDLSIKDDEIIKIVKDIIKINDSKQLSKLIDKYLIPQELEKLNTTYKL